MVPPLTIRSHEPIDFISASSPQHIRQFTSDNRSGVCPEAWEAMHQANIAGHEPSYGDDRWTRQATDSLRQLFKTDCDVYFVFNGTAANSLALASCCQSYHSVICHEAAHIETDECGAPEFFSNGTKLLVAPGAMGKLSLGDVETLVRKRNDIHYPKPRAMSVTQSTELGTVYTPHELSTLCQGAKSLGLRVHMDGARFANAVASLHCHPADITWRAGVDVLCFGGTKNGMSGGEAVVFFDRNLSNEFAYRCKQAGQLASKMRFISSQWTAMLNQNVWLKYATHSNAMATRLHQKLLTVPGVEILHPVQSNGVFARLPTAWTAALRDRGWDLYSFIGGATRFMCSWDTTPDDIDRVIADIKSVASATSATGA